MPLSVENQIADRPQSMVGTPLPQSASLRSCCRCGQEFSSSSRDLICPSCRKAKDPRHLSFRENQVINLVTEAKLNKEIAYELHLSEGTVKEYLNRIFRK